MHMPGMDGTTLAREIRNTLGLSVNKLPLVMFSSLGKLDTDVDDIGFAAFLVKPLKPSQLLEVLQTILVDNENEEKRKDGTKPRIDPNIAHRHPLRILLAEDNAVNQKLALRLLQLMGYRADAVSNGLEVIESVERQRYDVILMDVQMPEMDGLEATRQIVARWPQNARPKIVAMTANAMQGDREICLKAGMDDYLTKPIRVDELIASLLRIDVNHNHK
jgi:CheY-like chemotaxis protein